MLATFLSLAKCRPEKVIWIAKIALMKVSHHRSKLAEGVGYGEKSGGKVVKFFPKKLKER